jgi:hypothetical protein
MPVYFGHEVVRLWREFIKALQAQNSPLSAVAQTMLDDAIAESAVVVTNPINRRHRVSPIAW